MTDNVIGTIVVTNSGITVTEVKNNGWFGTGYDTATVENLQDAARILAAWLDLSYEDHVLECRRVSQRDQEDAQFRELIENMIREQS